MKKITSVIMLLGFIALWGCSQSSSGGSGAEGSQSSPVGLTVGSAYNGNVGSNITSYYRVVTTSGHQYTISLTNVSGDPDLYVFTDSGFSKAVCSSFNSGPVNDTCSAVASGSYLYIGTIGYNTDSTYTITVTDTTNTVSTGSEGTVVSPVNINSSYTGQVGVSSYSYYSFTAIQGKTYNITIGNMTADSDLQVYDSDSSYTNVYCSSANNGTMDDSCKVTATSGTVYFSVYGYGGSSSYSITVSTVEADEGSQSSPVSITSGYAGTVSASGTSSYYTIPVTAGKYVTVTLAGLTDTSNTTSLHVYSDAGYSSAICSNSGNSGLGVSCSGIVSGSAIYIKTSTFAGYGVGYNINVTENPPPSSEGSLATPISITNGYNGTIGVRGEYSYYTIPVTAGKYVTVTLAGLTDKTNLYVYSDSGFSSSICNASGFSGGDASCYGIASGSAIYIMTMNDSITGSQYGAMYTINVAESASAPSNEGLVSSPVIVTSGYTGQVASGGNSYYSFATTPGTRYTVTISGLSNEVNLFTHDNDSTYSSFDCSSTTYGTVSQTCSFIASGSTSYFNTLGYSGASSYTITIN